MGKTTTICAHLVLTFLQVTAQILESGRSAVCTDYSWLSNGSVLWSHNNAIGDRTIPFGSSQFGAINSLTAPVLRHNILGLVFYFNFT